MIPFRLRPASSTRALTASWRLRASSVLFVLVAIGTPVQAQPQAGGAQAGATSAGGRSTVDGVYTTVQAKRGADVYAGLCQSCHTAASHTGPPFRNKWVGRPLSDLFEYITREMPKTEPGSLTLEDYTVVLAYMLRMNGMPAGRQKLTSDTKLLQGIRIDLPTDGESASAASP